MEVFLRVEPAAPFSYCAQAAGPSKEIPASQAAATRELNNCNVPPVGVSVPLLFSKPPIWMPRPALVFITSSSKTNFNDDFESNSLLDIDEDYFQSINTDNSENELLCQSLEAALMETLLELRQHRQLRSTYSNISTSIKDKEQSFVTRL